jgi:hypothetical protein
MGGAVLTNSKESSMNTTKIEALKQAAEQAQAAYTTEQARLVEAGLKSAQRYELLKPLKAAADAAHAEYAKYAKGQINRALTAIIEADRPAREAAARARSLWKAAKFAAKGGAL